MSLYTNGPFTDLCRGPHAPTTKRIGAFKLQSVAGAYWRGDSDRQMLTRVYGTAFFKQKELDALPAHAGGGAGARPPAPGQGPRAVHVLASWRRACRCGSRRGWRSGTSSPTCGARENRRRGYEEVKTPILWDVELFKASGHWQNYRDNMYFTDIEDRPMGLKPMNCPGHVQLFKDVRRSYRDLPMRFSEQGLVHRHEPRGTLHGLMRVRHITQDDAHIFCTEEQIEDEVVGCLDFGFDIYKLFGFEPKLELSTRPEKRLGADEIWDHAEAALENALKRQGLEYEVNPGDGAFYGPKIDLHMRDSLGRSWQLGTVQLDYQMPERLDATYTGADNAEHRPVMIHRALLGSFERFIGILIEHYAGEFPLWLAPTQAIAAADRRPPQRRRPRVRRDAARRRRPRQARRPHRVRRPQDPRGRAVQDPLHAGRRRQRGRVRLRLRPPPQGRRRRHAHPGRVHPAGRRRGHRGEVRRASRRARRRRRSSAHPSAARAPRSRASRRRARPIASTGRRGP